MENIQEIQQDQKNTQEKKQLVINPNFFENPTDKEINYDKLIDQFGCQKITQDLLSKFELITGQKPHYFLTRGIFFSHRDLDLFLEHYKNKKPIYLYTGRGPSSQSMHLGHMIPFIFANWLQRVFNCPIVIQITEDEKFFYQKEEKTNDLEYYQHIANENIKDIIACGFDLNKTFIFKDTEYMQYLYTNVCKLQKCITYNQIKGIFGLTGSENSGKVAFPAIQASPCLASSFSQVFQLEKVVHSNQEEIGQSKKEQQKSKQSQQEQDITNVMCMVPMGIDQDPYFRMCRDVAQRLQFQKPCALHSKFFPALQGFKSKMSSSDPTSAIFLTDSASEIKKKINKYAFSGGQATVEEHRLKGGNLEVDIPYHYLRYFMEDDQKLEEIAENYSKGKMLTGEIKNEAIKILQEVVDRHQKARALVTDEVVQKFLMIRKIIL